MEKQRMLFGLLLMVLVIASSVQVFGANAYTGGVNVYVTMLSQLPSPAEPGSTVELRFKVENWGSQAAPDVAVELLPGFPFTIAGGESAQIPVGSMSAAQTGDNGVIIKYTIRIDPGANEGTNALKLRYKTSADGQWIQPSDYSIDVGTSQALIAIDKHFAGNTRVQKIEFEHINK